MLVEAGIIRDEDSHQKRMIKVNTNLVYKQQKYNLLREEVEGYAKLTLALQQQQPPSQLSAEVFSIIGHFDLDPNRVLDIILDVYEQRVAAVGFLDLIAQFRQSNLLHLLGNKFCFYHPDKSSNGSSQGDMDCPSSLYRLAATLIASGLVPLSGLLPYLLPSLSVTSMAIRVFWKSLSNELSKGSGSLENRVVRHCKAASLPHSSAQRSWLRRAPISQILSSATAVAPVSSASSSAPGDPSVGSANSVRPPPPAYPPPQALLQQIQQQQHQHNGSEATLNDNNDSTKVETECAFFSPQNNQVLGLAVALAELRAWPALLVLLRLLLSEEDGDELPMDAILCYSPALVRALLFLLRSSTYTLYCQQRQHGGDSTRFSEVPELGKDNAQYPQLLRLEDLAGHLQPLCALLDYHLAEDPVAFAQLSRLLEAFLQRYEKSSSPESLDHLGRAVVVPMLRSLTVSGPEATLLSSTLWPALRLMSYSMRYSLYELWQTGESKSGARPGLLVVAERAALSGSRHELKRLARENTKTIGRNLSKYLHATPYVVVQYLFSQIEAFDNLTPYVVEALRFATPLTRDVASLCILSKLRSAGARLKTGTTSYHPWYSALCRFVATLYGRYSSTEVKGLLHHLLHSLSAQQDGEGDLLLLKELLSVMAGCTTLLDVSPSQLEGLSGGLTLRQEVLGNVPGPSAALVFSTKQVRRAGAVLREELLASQTALPTLLLLARIRDAVLFQGDNSNEETLPLKVVSSRYDGVQDVLMQFADFLSADGRSLEVLARAMPSLSALVSQLQLTVAVACQLARPLLRAALQASLLSLSPDAIIPDYLQRWKPSSPDVITVLCSSTPHDVLAPVLVRNFWCLSVYDIYTPSDRYQSEMKRLKDRYADLDSKKHLAASSGAALSTAEYNKVVRQRETEMKVLMASVAALSEEVLSQRRVVEAVRDMLSSEATTFFPLTASAEDISSTLLKYLVIPRLLLSPLDAVYAAKFVVLLHDIGTPRFGLLRLLHHLFGALPGLLYSTTEAEAAFLGYAFAELFVVTRRWADSSALFKLEYLDKAAAPEEVRDLLLSIPTLASLVGNEDAHAAYLLLLRHWHSLLAQGLLHLLSGVDYIYIRCALVILTKIAPFFPHFPEEGKVITDAVQELISREKRREDLQIMGRSVSVLLKRHSFVWAPPPPAGASTVQQYNFDETNDATGPVTATPMTQASVNVPPPPTRGRLRATTNSNRSAGNVNHPLPMAIEKPSSGSIGAQVGGGNREKRKAASPSPSLGEKDRQQQQQQLGDREKPRDKEKEKEKERDNGRERRAGANSPPSKLPRNDSASALPSSSSATRPLPTRHNAKGHPSALAPGPSGNISSSGAAMPSSGPLPGSAAVSSSTFASGGQHRSREDNLRKPPPPPLPRGHSHPSNDGYHRYDARDSRSDHRPPPPPLGPPGSYGERYGGAGSGGVAGSSFQQPSQSYGGANKRARR
eukprot:scaffold1193_cov159-Ochromonas_danica.AAC.4